MKLIESYNNKLYKYMGKSHASYCLTKNTKR